MTFWCHGTSPYRFMVLTRSHRHLGVLKGPGARRWTTRISEAAGDQDGSQEGIPTGIKVLGGVFGAGLLFAFHYLLLGQREQQEAMYRAKIATLEEEVHQLRSRLKEVERARFKGKPVPQ
eukprot:symbB.v1.2.001645.t1/scaffold86.1/size363240/4